MWRHSVLAIYFLSRSSVHEKYFLFIRIIITLNSSAALAIFFMVLNCVSLCNGILCLLFTSSLGLMSTRNLYISPENQLSWSQQFMFQRDMEIGFLRAAGRTRGIFKSYFTYALLNIEYSITFWKESFYFLRFKQCCGSGFLYLEQGMISKILLN